MSYDWEPYEEEAEAAGQEDGIQLRFDDQDQEAFPDGVRNSTIAVCCCRALRELVAPEKYIPFPTHLEARGHGFERIMAEYLREKHGAHVLREIVIPWAHGETHADLLVLEHDGIFDVPAGEPVMIELKANKGGKLKPENVRQAKQQRWLLENAVRDGLAIKSKTVSQERFDNRGKVDNDGRWSTVKPEHWPKHWRVVVIDPLTWRIPDPHGAPIRLTSDDEQAIAQRYALIDTYLPLLGTLNVDVEDDWPACECNKCWMPHVADLPTYIEETAYAYDLAREEEKLGKAQKAIVQVTLRAQMIAMGKQMGGMHDPCEGQHFRVMLDKNMTPRVTKLSEQYKAKRAAKSAQ